MVTPFIDMRTKSEILKDYDVLFSIFGLLDNEATSGRRDLLSSARVCRAFKRPALDRLWAKLPSFLPVLALLPGLRERDGQLEGVSTFVPLPFTFTTPTSTSTARLKLPLL